MLRPILRGYGRAGTSVAGMMLAAAFALPHARSACAADPARPTTATGVSSTSTSPGTSRATTPSANVDRDVIAYINKYIKQGWADNKVPPALKANEYEWCRRVYLDLLGAFLAWTSCRNTTAIVRKTSGSTSCGT